MGRSFLAIVVSGALLAAPQVAQAKPNFVVQPIQVGAETVRFDQGVATVELYQQHGSVQIQPLPADHGSLAFYVGIFNAGDQPANIDITDFQIQAGSQSLAVFSREELEKKAKNRAMWTQIGLAALGGVAAAGAYSQRDTYRSTLYTPRGTYHAVYSRPSTIGQIQGTAIAASTGYAIYKVQEQLDATRRDLANSVVQLSTVDPGSSYGGKIVLAKIKDKKVPKDVTITLSWNGETYPFQFRLVKLGTPQPPFTNKLPPQTDVLAPPAEGVPAETIAAVSTGLTSVAPLNIGPVAALENYPPKALQEGREGTTGYRVAVSPDGSVTDCNVTSSSGHADLDSTTCINLIIKGRFAPAADGRVYDGTMKWALNNSTM
jgi:TonB family protein